MKQEFTVKREVYKLPDNFQKLPFIMKSYFVSNQM